MFVISPRRTLRSIKPAYGTSSAGKAYLLKLPVATGEKADHRECGYGFLSSSIWNTRSIVLNPEYTFNDRGSAFLSSFQPPIT
jgi:hypothetical protein